MGEIATAFLSSFNRIDKKMKEELSNPRNMGFSQMVRKLSIRKDLPIKKYENDLLQLSQLRNAIVHEQISEDFIIAEPNQWALDRIHKIEKELLQPELVCPRFKRKVVGFDQEMSLIDLLEIIAKKRYSQFPLYKHGDFVGLITLKGLGYWVAQESSKGMFRLENRKAKELLFQPEKVVTYECVSPETTIHQAESLFEQNKLLDAILIAPNANPNEKLLGIIRPRDIVNIERK